METIESLLNGIGAIGGVGPGRTTGLPGAINGGVQGPTTAEKASAPFSDLLVDAVGEVSQLQNQAQSAVSGLMTGSGVDIHQAMIATQKASMAFELALAVRNKTVQAYEQVMNMQF